MLKKAVSLLAALAMGVSSIVMAAPVFAAEEEETSEGFWLSCQMVEYEGTNTNNTVLIYLDNPVTIEKHIVPYAYWNPEGVDKTTDQLEYKELSVIVVPRDAILTFDEEQATENNCFHPETRFNDLYTPPGVVASYFCNWESGFGPDGTESAYYYTSHSGGGILIENGKRADEVFRGDFLLEVSHTEWDNLEYVVMLEGQTHFADDKKPTSSSDTNNTDPSGPSGGSEGPSSPADTTGPSAGNTSSGGGSASGGDVKYTVKQWDTLGHLSVNYYGSYDYHQAIYDANKEAFAKTGGKVVPGMVLTLPAKIGDTSILAPAKAAMGEKLYTVKSGETLGSIAASYYGSSKKSKEIFERNKDRLKDEVTLYEGQIIVLPKMEGKWQKSGDNWSYVLDTGKKLTNQWQWIDGNWYRFNSKGVMATGWQKVNGVWYYLQDDGAMLSNGWYTINKEDYYLNASGEMETGWLQLGNTWYYLQPKTGEKLSDGWQKIDGKWYYLYADGSMAADTTVDGYTVGKDGAWVK